MGHVSPRPTNRYPPSVPGGTKLLFHGVRGSTPCAGADYERYGGNTSCVSLEAEGHDPVIFDMGTGLRPCGDALAGDGPFHGTVLLTHLHWDHIQGLPFFGPISQPDAVLDVYGPAQEEGPLDAVFGGVMCPPYFPITPDELHGTVRFHGAGNDDFAVNGAKVRSRWIRHTSPTIGFRVDVEGQSVAYVSDHGPGCSDDPDDFIPPDVLDLADGVDVLIHDAQHTCEEFEAKRHFGHSSVDYAVHVARQAGARRLMLFHHCPSHSDDNVDLMHLYARALAEHGSGDVEVLAAREGLVVELQSVLTR
jgi:phosphoribosyl 1,2-cyclic phosphodiesterase